MRVDPTIVRTVILATCVGVLGCAGQTPVSTSHTSQGAGGQAGAADRLPPPMLQNGYSLQADGSTLSVDQFDQILSELPTRIPASEAANVLVQIDASKIQPRGSTYSLMARGGGGGHGGGHGGHGGMHGGSFHGHGGFNGHGHFNRFNNFNSFFGSFGCCGFGNWWYPWGGYYFPYSLYGGYYYPYYSSSYLPFLYGNGYGGFNPYGYGGWGGQLPWGTGGMGPTQGLPQMPNQQPQQQPTQPQQQPAPPAPTPLQSPTPPAAQPPAQVPA